MSSDSSLKSEWSYDEIPPGDRYRFIYGYDRNSNRIYRLNTPGNVSGEDELYQYDKLNRLTQFGRGTLPGTFDGFGPADEEFRQTWSLDALGNWDNFKEHEGVSMTLTLDQTRSHNKVNEIDTDDNHANAAGASIGIAPGGTGANWFDPVYDAAGNMTAFPKPGDPANSYTAIYDAWNRLVEVKDGSNTVAKYEYDGVGRRIVKDVHVSGSHDHYRHYYYTIGWQVIEERIDSATLADRQYAWGLRYVDELVLRDRDATAGGNLGVTSSGLDERLYCIQDANFNVTAITNVDGDGVERYRYSPYGERTVMDNSFGTRGSSNYDWGVGHQGLAHDRETGLVQNRARYLHVLLGRHTQRDRLGYVDGMNVYEYAVSNPIYWLDPSGLSVSEPVRNSDGTCTIHVYRDAISVPFFSRDEEYLGSITYRCDEPCAEEIAKQMADQLERQGIVSNVASVAGDAGEIVVALSQAANPIVDVAAEASNFVEDPSLLGAAAVAAAALPGPNPLGPVKLNKLKKLSDPEIAALKRQGIDPHDLKPSGSKTDLYRDRDGNIYVGDKHGTGFGEPTGEILE